jgi:uncharacterized membrane protein YbaN (DUF454 family)
MEGQGMLPSRALDTALPLSLRLCGTTLPLITSVFLPLSIFFFARQYRQYEHASPTDS